MGVIGEIDKILNDNKDYFVQKKQEQDDYYEKIVKNNKSDNEQFPLYSQNRFLEYEE